MTSPMTISQFREVDAVGRAERPKVFALSESDENATEELVAEVETKLGVHLSPTYKQFLLEYGGGDFGFINVFSADPNSEWYLPVMQAEASAYLPTGLLAFSDDSAGGYYVLQVKGGMAVEAVSYWNQDGGLVDTEFQNILEFVARYAYQPA